MSKEPEQTLLEIARTNFNMANDQWDEYQDPDWSAYDAFAANVRDAAIEQGYTPEQAFDAMNDFWQIVDTETTHFSEDDEE